MVERRGGVGNKDSSAFNMVCGGAKRHPACWEQVGRKTCMSGHAKMGMKRLDFICKIGSHLDTLEWNSDKHILEDPCAGR